VKRVVIPESGRGLTTFNTFFSHPRPWAGGWALLSPGVELTTFYGRKGELSAHHASLLPKVKQA